MIPSTQALADNIRKTCAGMAVELAKRCRAVGISDTDVAVVQVECERVLLDWFLGDFIPGQVKLNVEPAPAIGSDRP